MRIKAAIDQGWMLDYVPTGLKIGDTLKFWRRGEWGKVESTRAEITVLDEEEISFIKGLI